MIISLSQARKLKQNCGVISCGCAANPFDPLVWYLRPKRLPLSPLEFVTEYFVLHLEAPGGVDGNNVVILLREA